MLIIRPTKKIKKQMSARMCSNCCHVNAVELTFEIETTQEPEQPFNGMQKTILSEF